MLDKDCREDDKKVVQKKSRRRRGEMKRRRDDMTWNGNKTHDVDEVPSSLEETY